jgi:hypothetical protein
MTKSLKSTYTVTELATLAGVTRQRMHRLLRAYGVEPLTVSGGNWLIPLSELRSKMAPLVDSFKMRDMYEEIITDLDGR